MVEGFFFRPLRQALLEWLQSGMPSDRVFQETLREHRLGSSERAKLGALYFKLVRFAPLWRVEKSQLQVPSAMRAMEDAIHELADCSLAELRKRQEQLKPRFSQDPEKHFKKIHGLPDFLWPEVKRQPEAWHNFLLEMLSEAPLSLRFVSEEKLQAFLEKYPAHGGTRSTFLPLALHYSERWSVNVLEEFTRGDFEIQDEHSQWVGLLCAPQPGEKVLDLCAGGGGKTLHLASLMENRGEVWAYDIAPRKIADLQKRVRRSPFTNIRTLTEIPTQEKFDVVLVDSPCSGLGTLRRSPDRLWHLSEKEFGTLARTQSELLRRGGDFLKPGGRMIYSTCTVRPAENIQVLENYLGHSGRALDGFDVELKNILGERRESFLTAQRQTSAHKIGEVENFAQVLQLGPSSPSQTSGGLVGDGFFIARVK